MAIPALRKGAIATRKGNRSIKDPKPLPGSFVQAAEVAYSLIDPTTGKVLSGPGGIGYAAGGGAVTQATSSSTGVTLNALAGQITTVALTTAAGAEEVFTVTNSKVAATDVPVVATTYAGAGTALVAVKKVVAGAFDIVITNLHASSALNAAVVVNFAVIKASVA